jgi:hypothetical protein
VTCLNNSGATPSVALFHARRLNDIRLVSAIAGPRCYIVRVVHDDFVALRLPVSAIKFNLYRHRFSDTGAVVVKKYKKRDSAVRLSPVRHTKRHKRNVVLFFSFPSPLDVQFVRSKKKKKRDE